MKYSLNDPCPCDSGRSYKTCCQPLHKGDTAPSPEALMRSRYCAYKLGLAAYIMETTHPGGTQYQPDRINWKREIDEFCQSTQFVHLEVLTAEGDSVVFRATLFAGTHDVSFTELSLFQQHQGRWKYHSGKLMPR